MVRRLAQGLLFWASTKAYTTNRLLAETGSEFLCIKENVTYSPIQLRQRPWMFAGMTNLWFFGPGFKGTKSVICLIDPAT